MSTSPPTTPSRGPSGRPMPDTGKRPSHRRHVLGHLQPPLRPQALRPHLCRGPEKHGAGRRLSGGHPEGHAGAGTGEPADHAQVHDLHGVENSMYNTPPCFAIYTIQLVLKWLEEEIGGLEKMEARQPEKSRPSVRSVRPERFLPGTADADSRSLMNVTFRLPSEDLENTLHRRGHPGRIRRAQGASFRGRMPGLHLQPHHRSKRWRLWWIS